MKRKPQLILALDVDTAARARTFVKRLSGRVRIFKVGSQLFTAAGPGIVKDIRRHRAEVFLDLKFFDIPNTVAQAVRQATRLGVMMLTVHVSGGSEMLKAAVRAAAEESRELGLRRPMIIGVTVLTSAQASREQVLRLARQGIAAGLDGLVCSVREARFLRTHIKGRFSIVTPGIRPKGAAADDQKRTATFEQAALAGSDFAVVGRPVLNAPDPLRAVKELI